MTAPGSLLRWNGPIAAIAIVLISMTCMQPPAIGQTSSQGPAVSAVGPVEVVSIAPDRLILATARKPLVITLGNTEVQVLDSNGNEVSVTEITAGMYVTIVRRASGVTIRIVPKQEAKDGKLM